MIVVDGREAERGKTTGLSRILISFVKEASKFTELVAICDDRTNTSVFPKVVKIPRSRYFTDQFIIPPIIARLKPDIFFSIYPKAPILAPCKIAITIADLIGRSYLTVIPFAKRANLVFTLTHYWASILSSFIPQRKLFVVPPDIMHLRKKGKLRKPEYILYLGNFNPHKNLRRLLFAYRLACEEEDMPPLVLAGGGGRCAENLDRLPSGVKILGKVDDLEELFSKAILFVFPSLQEGFGIPPLEAAFYSVPLAISNIPVFRETFEDNAIYFDPCDVQSIKQALIRGIRGDAPNPTIIAHKFEGRNAGREILEIMKSV